MLVAYTLEILPYRIRAKGFAIMVSTLSFNPLLKCSSMVVVVVEPHRFLDGRFQPIYQSMGFKRHWMALLLGILRLARRGTRFYCIFYCGNQRFAGTSFLPYQVIETAMIGRTLEETAALFDGDQQPQDLAVMGGEAATMSMTMGRVMAVQNHEHDQKEGAESYELRLRAAAAREDDDRISIEL